MAFPHPQPGKDHDWNEDISRWHGVLRNFVKGAIDVAEDRNAEDQMDPSKDGAREAPVY